MGNFVRNLNLPFHPTEQYDWGGPATAQIILGQQGGWQNCQSGSPDPTPPNLNIIVIQNTLWSEIQANNSENSIYWATDPDGMEGALDLHYNAFVVYTRDTFLEACEQIVRTLLHYRVAVAALVYSGGHWVAVKGFQTTADPDGGTDWSIDGFFVHDCGVGPGEQILENHYIDLSQWRSSYFFENVYGPEEIGRWLNKYVVVGDPTTPLTGNLRLRRFKQKASGTKLLSVRDAIKYANDGIEEHMLLQDPAFKKAITGTEPGNPLLVANISKTSNYSYVVPFNRRQGTSALVIVDALYGHLREMASFPEPIEYPPISAAQADKVLRQKQIDVHSVAHSPSTTAVGLSSVINTAQHPKRVISDVPVWCPGPQGGSSFFPFYQANIGSNNLYVSSVNGQVFGDLRDFRFPVPCSKGGL